MNRITREVHEDPRGLFRVLWEDAHDIQEVAISVMKKDVLKGIHGDKEGSNFKRLHCVAGRIYHVAVDVENSQWEATELTPDGPSVVLAPGVGSAVLVLSDEATLLYAQTERYQGPSRQFTHRWNDPAFNIAWPTTHPILSERDRKAPLI